MEQAWPSIWLLIRSWITPSVLFLILNIVIGTIALTSKTLLAHRRPDDPAVGHNNVIARTASSALHRLRSISLTRLRSGDFFFEPAIAAAALHKPDEIADDSTKTETVEKEDEHRFNRSQSEIRQEVVEEDESPARITKSASERSGRGSFEKKMDLKKERAVVEEEVQDGVDARADDFINRFRQQLHLQRLDSLLNYKEMISRGN